MDFSELSLIGLRHALELAQSQGAKVIVYNVADYREVIPYQERNTLNHVEGFLNNRRNRIDKFLRRAFSELISQVELQLEADIGIAHERIVEKAEKEGVDMIVMSTHGRTGLAHMLIGSVTEQVVRHAPCPVLSIHPKPEEKATQKVAAAA